MNESLTIGSGGPLNHKYRGSSQREMLRMERRQIWKAFGQGPTWPSTGQDTCGGASHLLTQRSVSKDTCRRDFTHTQNLRMPQRPVHNPRPES